MKIARLSLLFACISTTYLANAYEIRSGGSTTVKQQGANAYSLPAANLPMTSRLDFSVGNSFFRNPWVEAPASTDARDGLGPLFNTNGCQNCHIKDGRGHPPDQNDRNAVSMLVRLSVPAKTEEEIARLITEGNIPDPTYGGQLQDFSTTGAKPEGQIKLTYTTYVETFSDGHTIELRKPKLEIVDLAYGPMAKDVQMSARIAPPMIGLGLLEAIPQESILTWEKEQASNSDGISGRPNMVWDVETQQTTIGRFGWKAGQPTLNQQNASAFNGDVGLTTSLFMSENCSLKQAICDELPNGGAPEVSDKILGFVEFYTQHLAVPQRRNVNDPQVIKGQQLFANSGCESCHKVNIKTAKVDGKAALSEQTIHPYTDLLLHDMGEGLADNRSEFIANGQEWRTPPLWGIGYTEEVNGHTNFLHDGRARNLMEAVLWHGGEAENSKQVVLKFNQQERDALIAFLQSL